MSLYDGRTNNFFVANGRDRGGDGVDLLLATRDQATDHTSADGLQTVAAPSSTGIALLRYLAPTPSAFTRADALRRSAVCAR